MLDKLPPSEAVEGQGIVLDSGLKTGQSLGRGWAAITDGYIYTDSNDNIKDFEIQTPTPGEKIKIKINYQLPILHFIQLLLPQVRKLLLTLLLPQIMMVKLLILFGILAMNLGQPLSVQQPLIAILFPVIFWLN